MAHSIVTFDYSDFEKEFGPLPKLYASPTDAVWSRSGIDATNYH